MSPRTALIGHTGFVGGNLLSATAWDACYNSRTIEAIATERFDTVVCAGVSAVKWLANKEPGADLAAIRRLQGALATVRAAHFVLLSTIDVYPDPARGGDEAEALDPAENHPYGRHRLGLEQWARQHFPRVSIVRLPALFGPGLKKNALYDLLHGNMVEAINPAARFQWYPVARLWSDIGRIERSGQGLVNLVTEPIAMRDIIARLFPDQAAGPERQPAPSYDVRTAHSRLFHGPDGYILPADAVMGELAAFVAFHKAA